jgi:hypothetical protein
MNKFNFFFFLAVANHSGAMEQRPFKNGRKSKSHTSRCNNLSLIIFTVFAVLVTSCNFKGKDKNKTEAESVSSGSEAKLVEKITKSDGTYETYEYDAQNRIEKISMYKKDGTTSSETITYDGNDLVKYVDGATEYITTKDKNEITLHTKAHKAGDFMGMYTLNDDGYPSEIANGWEQSECYPSHLKYQDGNLTEEIYYGDYEEYHEFLYRVDNKKSPFYHCETPKWFKFWRLQRAWVGNNNVIEVNATRHNYDYDSETTIPTEEGKDIYSYEYDSADYPTKCTVKYPDGTVEEYTFDYIPANL